MWAILESSLRELVRRAKQLFCEKKRVDPVAIWGGRWRRGRADVKRARADARPEAWP